MPDYRTSDYVWKLGNTDNSFYHGTNYVIFDCWE